jgi:hypothetical protein
MQRLLFCACLLAPPPGVIFLLPRHPVKSSFPRLHPWARQLKHLFLVTVSLFVVLLFVLPDR